MHPVRLDSCRPLLNRHGKAAYWVIAGLALLIIFSGAVIWYRDIGIGDKHSQPLPAPDRKEVRHVPHRYKIERPVTAPVKSVVTEAPTQTGVSRDPSHPSILPVEDGVHPVQLPETTDLTDQQTAAPPLETGQQTEESVAGGGPAFDRDPLEIRDVEGKQPPLDTPPLDPAADASEKATAVSSEEAGTPPPATEKKSGNRFFVQADVANVRDGPSMKSKVLFQIRNGCSVTVSDKRNGWFGVKMDDGRLGWVYHTLLRDSLVPRKDILPAVREIKTIRVEPPANQTVRVLFELSAPYIPEILVLNEKTSRIVCDFFDAKLAPDIGDRIVVKNGIIQTIRIGLHQQPQFKVRVVLDLEPGRRYEPKQVSGDEEDCFVLEIKAIREP